MAKLKVENFNLSFGKAHILKNINLEIKDKSITALIGPSGCGKTTLIRSINRLNDLVGNVKTSGKILLDDIDLYSNMDPVDVRKKIGMVFQEPNPFPKSIRDNVTYGLKMQNKGSNSQSKEMLESSLKKSGLWEEVKDKLKKSALELSGGQQQRLCIARTIAVEPEIIMMDEPTSALDPKSAEKVEQLVLELKKDYTVLIITHNLQQAERIADETVFMYLGEVIEKNTTQEIFKNPKDKLTKEYVKGAFG